MTIKDITYSFFGTYGFFSSNDDDDHAGNLIKAIGYIPVAGPVITTAFGIIFISCIAYDVLVKKEKLEVRDAVCVCFFVTRAALSFMPCGLALAPLDFTVSIVAAVIKHLNNGESIFEWCYTTQAPLVPMPVGGFNLGNDPNM